jgi:hypothetical protein
MKIRDNVGQARKNKKPGESQDKAAHKPGSVPSRPSTVMIIPLGETLLPPSSDRTRRHRASHPYPTSSHNEVSENASLFGLAPGGVYQALDVTIGTGALLPHRFTLTGVTTCSHWLCLTSTRRFVFCGTILRVTPTGRYPAPCSAEPGLSSPCRLQGAIICSPLP